ncbi:MAG: DUF4911 domain-containing protein [Candidatus Saganbacteria bacterium]|nr:DUF4911 domain-containing protein [Candidatus Saganbacteria bacterium]
MDSIDYFLRIKKEDIYLICPFFEAFEGMAAIRTPKPETGNFATLKLMVSPDFQADFEKLLDYLSGRLEIERLVQAA